MAQTASPCPRYSYPNGYMAMLTGTGEHYGKGSKGLCSGTSAWHRARHPCAVISAHGVSHSHPKASRHHRDQTRSSLCRRGGEGASTTPTGLISPSFWILFCWRAMASCMRTWETPSPAEDWVLLRNS